MNTSVSPVLRSSFGSTASLRGKLWLVMVTTIAVALLTMTAAVLYRDLAGYRRSLASELATQAAIMAQLASPALSFFDSPVAQRNLSALGQNPRIDAAALYTFDGRLLASHARQDAPPPPAQAPEPTGVARLGQGRMELVREVWRDGERLGVIYLGAHYDRWAGVRGYSGIVIAMLLLSMGVALLLAVFLRRAITGPVEALASVADDIVSRRDPTLRALDTPVEEFSVVVRAFNSVLDEAEERTRELRRSEKLYRAIGESIDFGVWVCDARGRNVYASDSFLRLTGLTQEQCAGFGWCDALHPDEAAATTEAWLACVQTGSFWYRENRYRGVDGGFHPVLSQGVPMRDEEGRITGWAGINLDISRLKKTEEALREADRRKDEFLATLAHELRNPLAPIRHAARLLGARRVDEAQARMAREIIARQVARMALLLDDLLEVSRITRGRLELRKERVSLAALVRAAVETSRPLIEAKRHELIIDVQDPPVDLHVDPLRLSQALSNLLTNAAKYTDAGGRIELVARHGPEGVALCVRDSGIGLPPEALPTIFEMFSQVDSAIDRSEGGLGIGLALVKGLVVLHGGTVEAASDGLGMGSTFTIRLPADCLRQPLQQPVAGRGEPEAAGPKGSVLVVDDNQDAATALAMVLRNAGHHVIAAHSGEEALRAGWQHEPDAVLLDIGMPDLNGYEVARRMRGTGWGRHALLIALTGWGQKGDIERAGAAGFDVHLTKPADPGRIEELLQEYLAGRAPAEGLRTGEVS
ncbi:MAG: ATP-binding protein [Pseudomonadota bacterium]|nr:MAG: hypothetical protein DIU62_04075 [Pseudomonadota bacterium]